MITGEVLCLIRVGTGGDPHQIEKPACKRRGCSPNPFWFHNIYYANQAATARLPGRTHSVTATERPVAPGPNLVYKSLRSAPDSERATEGGDDGGFDGRADAHSAK